MALRLMEISLPNEEKERIAEILKDYKAASLWYENLSNNQMLIKVILPAEKAESIMDRLQDDPSRHESVRMILLPVEAVIPRQEAPPEETLERIKKGEGNRISREELYGDVLDSIKLSGVFVSMVILSTIVAALGLLRENVTAIIGAMIIAPLLGPNVALTLATTLGDLELAMKAIKVNVVGLLIALAISFIFGLVFVVNIQNDEIMSRTTAGLGDVALAFASGSAGALAFTTGISATLIGVMMSVALLPPLVTFGLLWGSGQWNTAQGALTLLVINLICVNLAGVLTFLLQGVRPLSWWEVGKAKRAAAIALTSWILLLMLLLILTCAWFQRKHQQVMTSGRFTSLIILHPARSYP